MPDDRRNVLSRPMTAREYEDRVLRAKRAILRGEGYEAAAQILRISPRYVKKLAQDGKLPRSMRKGAIQPRPLDWTAFAAALDSGESTASIARRFGRSETFVRNLRKGQTRVDFDKRSQGREI